MTPIDPNTFWLLLGISIAVLSVISWRVYRWQSMTAEMRLRVEAQRLILRFCKRPTQSNFDAAWELIDQHDIQLTDLDWDLVNRFARTDFHHNAQEGLT